MNFCFLEVLLSCTGATTAFSVRARGLLGCKPQEGMDSGGRSFRDPFDKQFVWRVRDGGYTLTVCMPVKGFGLPARAGGAALKSETQAGP